MRYCFLCSFPILIEKNQKETKENTNDLTCMPYPLNSNEWIHKSCLALNSPFANLIDACVSSHKVQEEQNKSFQKDDIQHSAQLYRAMGQLYFIFLPRISNIVLSDNQQLVKRCHPMYGCNQVKPINEYNPCVFDSLFMDPVYTYDRRCRTCTLQASGKVNRGKRKFVKEKLLDLLNEVIKHNYPMLVSVVSVIKNKTEDDVKELKSRIYTFCTDQWKQQNGKCAHCDVLMYKTNAIESITPALEDQYVDRIFSLTFNYKHESHEREWIHQQCTRYHEKERELFTNILKYQYSLVFRDSSTKEMKTPHDGCLCEYFHLSFRNLIQYVCERWAFHTTSLKTDPLWIQTWKLLREECGDEVFQEIANFLLEKQQKKNE